MKKQIALIFILLFTTAMSYSQVPAPAPAPDCSKLKNIKAADPDYPKRTFILKEATQESYENGVLHLVWSVKRNSDCEYEITCTKKLGESQLELGDRIVMTIVSVDDECFTVKRTFFCKNFPEGDIDPGSTYCIIK
jgi:hypothetical protein